MKRKFKRYDIDYQKRKHDLGLLTVCFFFPPVDLNEQFCEHQHQEHNVSSNLSLSLASQRV